MKHFNYAACGGIVNDREREQLQADNAMLVSKTERQEALLEYVAAMSDVDLPEEPADGEDDSEPADTMEE